MEAKTEEYKKIKKKNKISKIIYIISIITMILSISYSLAYYEYADIFAGIFLISIISTLISNKIRKNTNYIIKQIEINKISINEANNK